MSPPSPRLLRLTIPEIIWKEQRTAVANAEKRPAKNDDVFEFLTLNPLCAKLEAFDELLRKLLASTKDRVLRVPQKRLQLWRSQAGKNAPAEW